MRHVGTILGSAIAGIFVMSVWGGFAEAYGIAGGWFAGLIIIGSMWYLNHYLGLIDNPGAFIDMGLGIGVAGFMRDVFINGSHVAVESLPTLVIVLVGGACGGVAAVMMEKHWVKSKAEEEVKKAA